MSSWCVVRLLRGLGVHRRRDIGGRALFLNPTGGGSNPGEDMNPPNDPRLRRLLFCEFSDHRPHFHVAYALLDTSIPENARGPGPIVRSVIAARRKPWRRRRQPPHEQLLFLVYG